MFFFIDRNIVKHSEETDYSNERAHRKRAWVGLLGAGTGLTCGPTADDPAADSGRWVWRVGEKECWQKQTQVHRGKVKATLGVPD